MAKDIFVVGNKVSIPPERDISKHEVSNSIIFVGKMNYEPNVLAVGYFSEWVYPVLREKFPELIFTIVGMEPDSRVKRLSAKQGIKVTGFVESVIPYYQNATIVVAPMLTGAGIQNKIIQAMAYGCCVVTTPIGAEGLEICNNEIGIYESSDEMVKGLCSLLSDRDKRVRMGRLARNYVITNLSEDIISKQFWNFIGKI